MKELLVNVTAAAVKHKRAHLYTIGGRYGEGNHLTTCDTTDATTGALVYNHTPWRN
jgi:hypothetical protein